MAHCLRAAAAFRAAAVGGVHAAAARAFHAAAPAAGLRDWLHLWKSKQDVFTDKDVNINLLTYLGEMLPSGVSAPGAASQQQQEDDSPPSVLVPLCGRTKDLVWLANKGYLVVGIEAIAEPLLQWAEVNGGLEPIGETDKVTSYRSPRFPNLNVIHGNVFDVTDDMFGDLRFDAVWDRAGITSLHDEERPEYLRKLHAWLRPGGRLMLEFLSCNVPDGFGSAMDGAGMRRLMDSAGFATSVLKEEDVRDHYPDFKPQGLQYLNEVVMLGKKPMA